jgi:hypothetical protein
MLTQATGHYVDVVTNKYSSFISYLLSARLNDIKYLLGTLAYLSTLCAKVLPLFAVPVKRPTQLWLGLKGNNN